MKSPLLVQEDNVIGQFLDAAKEETIAALRAELARLQQSQHAQQVADSALASLQQKIDSLQVRSGLSLSCGSAELMSLCDHKFAVYISCVCMPKPSTAGCRSDQACSCAFLPRGPLISKFPFQAATCSPQT